MPLPQTAFYITHLAELHQRLLGSEIALSYFTGLEIRLDGEELHPSDLCELPIGVLSGLEFTHLFSVFNGSRVHQQIEHSLGLDNAPPGLYFTIVNSHLIQHPHKNRIGLYSLAEQETDLFIEGLHIDQYFLNERKTPPLLGTVSFSLCAITAHLSGLSHISLIAAGGQGFNNRHIGYRVWPKLGFDAPLLPNEVAQASHLSTCKTVQDVLATDATWWLANGSQRMMTFDLGANSPSWHRLLAYLSSKLPNQGIL